MSSLLLGGFFARLNSTSKKILTSTQVFLAWTKPYITDSNIDILGLIIATAPRTYLGNCTRLLFPPGRHSTIETWVNQHPHENSELILSPGRQYLSLVEHHPEYLSPGRWRTRLLTPWTPQSPNYLKGKVRECQMPNGRYADPPSGPAMERK
jgi:hypothetical protein